MYVSRKVPFGDRLTVYLDEVQVRAFEADDEEGWAILAVPDGDERVMGKITIGIDPAGTGLTEAEIRAKIVDFNQNVRKGQGLDYPPYEPVPLRDV